MSEVPNNVVGELKEPAETVSSTIQLAKNKRKSTISDAHRMPQMEDSLCGMEQKIQNSKSKIYESVNAKLEAKLDAKLAENNAQLQLIVADTICYMTANAHSTCQNPTPNPSSKPTSISSSNKTFSYSHVSQGLLPTTGVKEKRGSSHSPTFLSNALGVEHTKD